MSTWFQNWSFIKIDRTNTLDSKPDERNVLNFIPPFFQILYMWSRNGSGIHFPQDSAVTIGGSSPIQLLVLQVHYIDNSNILESGDSSGILVHYHSNPVPPLYNVGIFSLHNHGIAEPNGLSSWESACHLGMSLDLHMYCSMSFGFPSSRSCPSRMCCFRKMTSFSLCFFAVSF